MLPTAGRENTSSFPSMRKFVDVCEILEVANGVTVLPKDGNRRRQALWSGSTPHLAPLRPVELSHGAWRQGGGRASGPSFLRSAAVCKTMGVPPSRPPSAPGLPLPQAQAGVAGTRHAILSAPCGCGWPTPAAWPGALQCPRPAHARPGRAKEHWWQMDPRTAARPQRPLPPAASCAHAILP